MDTHTLGDILANSITHGVGALLAVCGAAYLVAASTRGSAWEVASCSIFGATLVLVYVCSTLYHSLVRTRARHFLRVLDHSAIYLLIAGTYTPFTLISLRGRVGWILFSAEWALAIAGVAFKSVGTGKYPLGSTLVYLFQGWLAVFAAGPILHAINWQCLTLVVAGGLAYTFGILFFALDRYRYFHAMWHVFVLAGSAAHYFAILLYVIPRRV